MKKTRHSATLMIVIVFTLLFSLLPSCLSENHVVTYELLNEADESAQYRLNVAVSQSLLDYYVEKSHRMNAENDFAKFVTPYALKPVANCLSEIFLDDESFSNGVLMITHQIQYEVTVPAQYPVETIVDNKGDCDLFSYIAASILKAKGLNVVLLYYEKESHMNIGVSLAQEPRYARTPASYVTYGGNRYYVAECTGGNWQHGWRIGELPQEITLADAQIVTLENSDQSTTGQVSASYKVLATSSLTFDTFAAYVLQGSIVTFSGRLSPAMANASITVYVKMGNLPWQILDTVPTDSYGGFSYVWNLREAGIYYFRASWSGNEDYATADSIIRPVTSLSTFFVMLVALSLVLGSIGIVTYIVSRQKHQVTFEPQPPEIPS